MIKIASTMAPHSNARHKLGAVVAAKKPIGQAFNWNRNTPPTAWESAQCAEFRALRDAGDSRGATMYVVRVNRHGNLRMARPCEECQVDMRNAGISKVIYSINDGEFGLMKL